MPLGYMLQRTVTVEADTLGVFSARFDNYYFLGGAHPNYFTSFINTDLSNGSNIKLSGIFNPGYENELNKIGESKFRAKRDLKPDEDLTEAGYWFDKGKFKMNDNFVITAEGISFFFNSYEIGPYALGTTEIMIDYSEIKDLIKKDGVLARFIK